MDTIHQGIITLLRSAVTGEKLALPAGFDIEAAYPQIKRHHMVTLTYDGAVRCGIPSDHPVMQQLFGAYCRALMKSEGQQRELKRIFAAFDENGIDYMPLKGCKMKALYPKPELRIMGDADILIRMEQYQRIVPIMESLGFADSAESDHELVWKSPNLYLELHKRLIPSYNEDFYAYYGDGWKLAKCAEGTRFSMTPEDEMIYLFTHFAKHYRDGGIGCRHVVDLWVYRRANPGLDEAYIRRELEKLRLYKFYVNILQLLAVWFEDAAPDDKMEFMTGFLFASGSWGVMDSRVLSIGVRDMRRTGGSLESRLRYILRTAFPSREVLRHKYTVLQKAPWLLPLVWLVRPFYKLLFERESLDVHGRQLKAMNQKNLDQRHQLLNYVGLDYNF